MRILSTRLAFGCSPAPASFGPRRFTPAPTAPFTVEDLVRLKRISDPQVSPDGRVLAFVQRETDMKANKGRTSLWLLDLAGPRRRPAACHRRAGERLQSALGTRRPHAVLPLEPLGHLAGVAPEPAGTGCAARHRLSPRCGFAEGLPARRPAGAVDGGVPRLRVPQVHEGAPRKARRRQGDGAALYDRIFIRHWDTWSDGTRSHLFTAPVSAARRGGHAGRCLQGLRCGHSGEALRRMTRATTSARTASGWCSRRASPGRTEPWSTNFDLFETPADGSAAAREPHRRQSRLGRPAAFSCRTAIWRGSRRTAPALSPTASTSC